MLHLMQRENVHSLWKAGNELECLKQHVFSLAGATSTLRLLQTSQTQ